MRTCTRGPHIAYRWHPIQFNTEFFSVHISHIRDPNSTCELFHTAVHTFTPYFARVDRTQLLWELHYMEYLHVICGIISV